MEVDRKFQQQKSLRKNLVKSQEQSRAELMQLLQWDASAYLTDWEFL